MTASYLMRVLRRRLWLVFTISFVVTGLVYLKTRNDRILYQSIARLTVSHQPQGGFPEKDSKYIESLIEKLNNTLRHSPTPKVGQVVVFRTNGSNVIEIWAKSENPVLSATLVNNACTHFLTMANHTLRAAKNKPAKSITRIESFKQHVGPHTNIPDRASAGQIDQLKTLLITAQNELYSLEIEQSGVSRELRNQLDLPSPEVRAAKTNAEIIRLRNEIRQTKHEAAGTSDDKLSNRVTELRNRLADAENNAGVPDDIPGPKTPIEDLEKKSNELALRVETLKRSISDSTARLDNLERLYRAGVENNMVHSSFQKTAKHYQSTNLKSRESYPAITQTLFGKPAPAAMYRSKLFLYGATFSGTFIIGIIGVLLLNLLSSNLKNTSQFNTRVGLPLLGLVNKLPAPDKDILHILNDPDNKNQKEKTFKDLVKKARFNVEHSGDKIFLITSTKASEGKTTFLIALGTMLADVRKNVLLIDTNFLNNSITRYFQSKPMLEELWSYETISRPEFDEAISTTPIKGLDVIGCKGGLYSPGDLLIQKSFISNLGSLAYEYDYVFLEGASLNKYADSKELTQFADGVISVFSARSTVGAADKESIAYLHSLNGKFRGAVLNNVLAENIDL